MTATIEIFYKGHFGNRKQTGVKSFETISMFLLCITVFSEGNRVL